ncbi:MAG TPA: DUF2235 domain-containing protein [Ideonella sp.]|nr:DUF2235 domain-containing protein [Ideonella sp.]
MAAVLASSPLQPRKTIVVFSDGTGNSSAKLNKTNVWRLYQALDLARPSEERSAAGDETQIALYDDGVGSSGFLPVALLGGAFGFGLKRNVLDLYKFLCRNYRPGDRIYAFGFSRGAFTIRVLMGFVLKIGLLKYESEHHLAQHVQEAYREYRATFKAPLLAGAARWLRDAAIGLWRRLRGTAASPAKVRVEQVEFVGVWDTVAAYGTPLAEMTRAVDRWIWPLSMPNYVLSPRVRQARHALALDDERDTFHPLLWDEVAEAEAVARREVAPMRLRQVWFAGMHSDVGGGYPDDSLSYVSLDWMMGEAETAGLRFKPRERGDVERGMDPMGPIHDSRSGLAVYYRYQPRKLSARIEPPDPSTLLMQDPNREEAHGRLLEVVIHPSVKQRILYGPDGYAPITLPPAFSLDAGPAQPLLAAGSEQVWNSVWRRRITYFFGLAVSSLFVLMPVLPRSDCGSGLVCLLSPAIDAAGSLLPSFLQPWVRAWAANPGVFAILGLVMFMTLRLSGALQRTIDDQMSDVWQRTFGAARGAPPEPTGTDRFIQRLRTHGAYQKFFQQLKWRLAPALFALAFLALVLLAALLLAHRIASA